MSFNARSKMIRLAGFFVALSLVLAACTPAASTPAAEPTAAPAQNQESTAPTQAEAAPTQAEAAPAEATAAPAEGAPQVGGTLVISILADPDTLDAQLTSETIADSVMYYIGGALVTKDPDNKFVPWLAESWEISTDGLTYTFHLRKDVKFQDGTPLTAKDWKYTYERALNPETNSPGTGPTISSVKTLEAPDDYTLVMTLSEPNYFFLDNLTDPGYMMPLSQAYLESKGADYGRNPMSVGPYKFSEWVTGDHITLERNPDYKWQAAYAKNQGPYNIEKIIFRIIPEMATIIAGLEAGELDFVVTGMDSQNIERVKATDMYALNEGGIAGALPFISINVSKPPFDDLKVRQAFNLAVDRQALIDVILKGNGTLQYGPISPSVVGYWDGVEKIGYGYDAEKAKTLLAEAGYTAGSDGILAKAGQPLKIDLMTRPVDVKVAEMVKEQYKAVGVELNIVQLEAAVISTNIITGAYNLAIFGYRYPNADIMYMIFHSSQIGALNLANVNDPELDGLLEKTRTETDPAKQQEYVNQVQQWVVEKAIMIPLYNPTMFYPLSKKVQGAIFSPKNNLLYLEDAYIQQ